MNKVKVAGFLACLVAVLLIISFIIKPEGEIYNIVAVKEKFDELEEQEPNSADVVFLGDSEVYAAYFPLQMFKDYGITSYIAATSAQRLCDSYVVLEKVFEKQNPKLLVIETGALFRYAGTEKNADNFGFNLYAEAFPVFKYHSRWKNDIREAIRNTAQSGIDYRGFLYRTTRNPYNGGEYMFYTDEKTYVSELVPEYLDKILKLCKEHNVDVTFVSSPTVMHWDYKKHNGATEYIGKLGYPYIDLNLENDKIKIDWKTDTKDCGDHVNYYGAVKVTDFYGKYLKEHYDLEDHRNDPKCDSWREDVKNFYENEEK